ncbi:glycosyltransferase family 4 protein [Thiohalomonas denitrificans]|uniref:glycosyltransferase family 4 protein n=1 Tax=Thiohalomonas denitrificans TaxID=415747 RepID=UPI0026F07B79|nr:glycosyltransferase family 4 protein [Thiohalomonas denitrificans]
MRILFVDPKSTTPYDFQLMESVGIGGTEASLVRVAEGVSRKHDVVVAQLGRKEPYSAHAGLRYVSMDEKPFGTEDPDVVVVVRKHRLTPVYRERYPQAAIYCWIHNWQRAENVLKRYWLARNGCGVIAVSDAHLAAADRIINGLPARLLGKIAGAPGLVPIQRIYNPINDELNPDSMPVNPDQLIFFSTANKGLREVLRTFARVRERFPLMKLLVAGNRPEGLRVNLAKDLSPGVELVGRLPQAEVLKLVRQSLCVFYPQTIHPETFGLIYAEANAVGTPVLAHDFGAAREVLGGHEQLVDGHDVSAVIAKLAEWRDGGRPRVSARPQFRTTRVIAAWHEFIEPHHRQVADLQTR